MLDTFYVQQEAIVTARQSVRNILTKLGIRKTPQQNTMLDIPKEVQQLIRDVDSYTMTSPERINALWEATQYVARANIPGSFVECGVWRGGSMMVVAKTLLSLNDTSRDLYLFDTFEGMTTPTERDVAYNGTSALAFFETRDDWCAASLVDVETNMKTTGYPDHLIHYVRGPVEETIPEHIPDEIALLRLDTDWYASTKHELLHLYPRLVMGGVLILDDYGHWEGSRGAVDEYFKEHQVVAPFLRIDSAGRILIKTA